MVIYVHFLTDDKGTKSMLLSKMLTKGIIRNLAEVNFIHIFVIFAGFGVCEPDHKWENKIIKLK